MPKIKTAVHLRAEFLPRLTTLSTNSSITNHDHTQKTAAHTAFMISFVTLASQRASALKLLDSLEFFVYHFLICIIIMAQRRYGISRNWNGIGKGNRIYSSPIMSRLREQARSRWQALKYRVISARRIGLL